MTLYDAATQSEQETLHRALFALQHAAGHLSAIDVSNAEANLQEVRYRPLTQQCIDAAGYLADLLGGPTGDNVGQVRGEVHEIGDRH